MELAFASRSLPCQSLLCRFSAHAAARQSREETSRMGSDGSITIRQIEGYRFEIDFGEAFPQPRR